MGQILINLLSGALAGTLPGALMSQLASRLAAVPNTIVAHKKIAALHTHLQTLTHQGWAGTCRPGGVGSLIYRYTLSGEIVPIPDYHSPPAPRPN